MHILTSLDLTDVDRNALMAADCFTRDIFLDNHVRSLFYGNNFGLKNTTSSSSLKDRFVFRESRSGHQHQYPRPFWIRR